MSYFRHGDPLDDFASRDREQSNWLDSLPVCEHCTRPIQGKHLYLINDEFICTDCLIREFRKDTEDYVEKR